MSDGALAVVMTALSLLIALTPWFRTAVTVHRSQP